MKKILFLIHDLLGGGAEKVLVNLVNHMDKSSFDITIQTLFDIGVNKEFISSDVNYIGGIKKVIKGNSYITKVLTPRFLYQHIIRDDYDIIVSYLEGPCAKIVSGCTDKKTKLVCWIHCRIDNKKVATEGFRNYKEAKKCYDRFDSIACVSQWVMASFTKTFNFQKRVGVYYNTIETDKVWNMANEGIDDIIFDNRYVNICSTGKITTNKAFDRIARIHKKLVDEGYKNRVYILGVGEEQETIEKYLKENCLQDSFFFLGYKTNPYKYVKSCDLYVCSSYSEGFSTAVTEALIVGTPVVATRCSGMSELLGENNEYGLLVENNEVALYEGVKRMVQSPGLRKQYSKRAFERGKKFCIDKTIQSVENMLKSL